MVFDESRYAKPWWFVSGVKSWHAMALVELLARATISFIVGRLTSSPISPRR
jgi:hypothetical protein